MAGKLIQGILKMKEKKKWCGRRRRRKAHIYEQQGMQEVFVQLSFDA